MFDFASLDELVARARQETFDGAAANASGRAAVAETGILAAGRAVPDEAALEDVRQWRAHAAHTPSEIAVFMDNTTLVSVQKLSQSGSSMWLTPATLFDLATFATNAIVFHKVYHMASDEVPDEALNAQLGGDHVLVPIPLPTDGDPQIGASGVLHKLWYDTGWYLRTQLGSDASNGIENAEALSLRSGWQCVLGRDLQGVDVFDSLDQGVSWYPSAGRSLLEELVQATEVIDERRLWPTPRQPVSEPSVPSGALERFIRESNYRGYFNAEVAKFLGLAYFPNAARLPIMGHTVERGLKLQRDVAALEWIQRQYKSSVDSDDHDVRVNLQLPFFFGSALLKMSRPEDFWTSVSDLRRQARPFRDRLSELNAAVARGDRVEARRLREALDSDALTLRNALSYVPVVTLLGAILGLVSVGTVPTILAGLIALVGVAKEVPEAFRHQLAKRLLRPDLYFLTDLASRAQHMTNAIDRIVEVWRLNDSLAAPFAARFQSLGRLGHG